MRFARSVVSALVLTAVRSAAAFAAASSRRPNKISATSAIRTTSSLLHHSDSTCSRTLYTTASNPFSRRRKLCHASLFSSSLGHTIIPRGGGLAYASSTALHSTVSTEATETTTTTTPPIEIFRKDYRPLRYTVSEVSLDFDLHPNRTIVTNRMVLSKPPTLSNNDDDDEDVFLLDGDASAVQLLDIQIDGRSLQAGEDYVLDPSGLKLLRASSVLLDQSHISITTEIVPETNTQLSGLYVSDGVYCTQCEAMGFRRITYYPDRPDNMAIFKAVKIQADKQAYPLLLSNGNLIEQGDIQDDGDGGAQRHYAVWSDPFPKPSYLFAMVAGNLGVLEDTYTTMSGKTVQLKIYSEPHNVHQLSYAMQSLKDAMKWDEQTYGLEYDLDIYNIVAVDNFNMGAMENKSLNVFNTAYVLADPKTATDGDYERVQAVIGHEYFHNWTGNRVTCRDWFQLTLKEGLTVFRDQEFSGDMMRSKAVKRIEDVRGLRARQFQEDAGPMAHPVRPESYISMDNFYTGTVYIKGAEIVRMYQTILSREGFRKGMDLYFQRHDGSAVTCDDFLAAMADANNVDLSQFARWYSTSGTPTITYASEYNAEAGTFTLTLSQSSRSTEGPLHIPVSVGLLDKKTGQEVVPTTVLDFKEEKQTFQFDGLKGDVVLSLLRDFSAPVKLEPASGQVDEEALAFLAAYDTDGFNRWEAGQKLYSLMIFQMLERGEYTDTTLQYVYEAFGRALADPGHDYSIQAYTLILPTESTLAEEMEVVDPLGIHKARGAVKKALARKFSKDLRAKYDELTRSMADEGEFQVDAEAIGRRRLRNVLLDYLCSMKDTDEEQVAAAELATQHFQKAQGMTDKMAALTALASMDGLGASARDEAMHQFYVDAQGESLVLNKWFTVQATADLPDVLDRVKKLKQHPDFTMRNPNRCRSLIGAYASNSAAFHDEAGLSYEFMGDAIAELDQVNPQVSSRMASCLIQWRRYDPARGQKMKAVLEKLAAMKPISDDLYEIVNKALS